MKSIKHYFNAIKAIWQKNRSIHSRKRKRRKNIKEDIKICQRLLQDKNLQLNMKEQPSLDTILQDNGKLCDKTGFAYQPTLDLSIIIPMYNAKAYIKECLDSVLNQQTKYIYEIVLIDDGSTDDALQEIEEYLQDERVVLLKQENQGQSVARNNAIFYSRGRYIMMIDSDDLLLPGSIEVLLDTAIKTNSDIVEGKVTRFHKEPNQEDIFTNKKIKIRSSKKKPYFVLSTYGYSVAKVYKRELWEKLRYPEGYIFEDIISKFILRRKANQVAFLDYTVYGYRWNYNSTSHGKNLRKKLDSLLVLPKVIKLCEQEKVEKDETFYLLCLNHIGLLNFVTTKNFEREERLIFFAEMQKQLKNVYAYRPKKMPKMFQMLEESIINGNFESWQKIAETIQNYQMLKKYREIN